MSKANEKKGVVNTPQRREMVSIFKTTYYYLRYWIKAVLVEGKISKYRFLKDEIGYTGHIAIDKPEVEKAKKVLSDFKKKNSDTVEMWW